MKDSWLRPPGRFKPLVAPSSGSTGAAPADVWFQRLAVLLLLGGVAGCQTGAEYQADVSASLDARLEAYSGRSMAEFMGRTGMLPISTYDVSEGRVFVFRTDPVYVTLPATHVTPTVTRSDQCQLLVRAVPVGTGQGADNWKIVGTQRTGPCNNLPA